MPFDHPLWVLYSSGTTGPAQGHRARPRRHRAGAPEGAAAADGARAGRAVLLVHHHRLDDVELPHRRPAGRRRRSCCSTATPATPTSARCGSSPSGTRVTYFGVSAPFIQSSLKAGLRPRDALRPRRAAGDRLDRGTAVGRGLPLDRRRGRRARADLLGVRRDRRCARRSSARPRPCRCGWARSPARRSAPPSSPTTRTASELVDEVGELVITEPMPSMPVSFWNDPDGSRLREAYFEDYPGRLAPRRLGPASPPAARYVIYGRSDSTLNRGGVRMGTADFYAVVEGFDEVVDSLVIDTTELGAPRRGRAAVLPGARRRARPGGRRARLRKALRVRAVAPPRARPVHRRRRGAAHPQRQEVRGAGQEDPRRGGRRTRP